MTYRQFLKQQPYSIRMVENKSIIEKLSFITCVREMNTLVLKEGGVVRLGDIFVFKSFFPCICMPLKTKICPI